MTRCLIGEKDLEPWSEEVRNLFLTYRVVCLMGKTLPGMSRVALAKGLKDLRRKLRRLLGPDYRADFRAWMVAQEFTRSYE